MQNGSFNISTITGSTSRKPKKVTIHVEERLSLHAAHQDRNYETDRCTDREVSPVICEAQLIALPPGIHHPFKVEIEQITAGQPSLSLTSYGR